MIRSALPRYRCYQGYERLHPVTLVLLKVKLRKEPAAHGPRVGVRRRILLNDELAAPNRETTP